MTIPKLIPGSDVTAATFLKQSNGQEDYGVKTNSKGKLHPVFSDSGIEFTPTENVEKGQLVYVTESGFEVSKKPITVNVSAVGEYNIKSFLEKSNGDITVFGTDGEDGAFGTLIKNEITGIYELDESQTKAFSLSSSFSKVGVGNMVNDNVYYIVCEYSGRLSLCFLKYDGNSASYISSYSSLSGWTKINQNEFLIMNSSNYLQKITVNNDNTLSVVSLGQVSSSLSVSGAYTTLDEIKHIRDGIYAMSMFYKNDKYRLVIFKLEDDGTVTWANDTYTYSESFDYSDFGLTGHSDTNNYYVFALNQSSTITKYVFTINDDLTFTTTRTVYTGSGLSNNVIQDLYGNYGVSKRECSFDGSVIDYESYRMRIKVTLGTSSFSVETKTAARKVYNDSFVDFTNSIISIPPKGNLVGFIYEDKEAGETATVTTANILDLFESLEVGEYYKVNENGVLETTTENYTGEKFLAINNTTLIKK